MAGTKITGDFLLPLHLTNEKVAVKKDGISFIAMQILRKRMAMDPQLLITYVISTQGEMG